MAVIPRTYTFTLEDVWRKAVEVARHYPDRVNERVPRDAMSDGVITFGPKQVPVYFKGGTCSCLFGHVLKGLGVAAEDVTEGEGIGIVLDRLLSLPALALGQSAPTVYLALCHLQIEADKGEPWAEAVWITKQTFGEVF